MSAVLMFLVVVVCHCSRSVRAIAVKDGHVVGLSVCMALVFVVDKKKLLLLLYCYEHNSSVLISALLRVYIFLQNTDCA